jgi:threonine synthase
MHFFNERIPMFEVAVECSKCGELFDFDKPLTVCTRCGGALLIRYDLAKVARNISKKALAQREDSFWKFKEVLPLTSRKSLVTLGEPYTPLLPISKKHTRGFKNVCIKDDGRLPTGTFKARGMAVLVSKLKELGVRCVALPSAGNAAGAIAAYAAKARMDLYAFMPNDVPESNLKESVLMEAKVYLVKGLINDAAAVVKRLQEKYEWFDASTNKQPYRFEGYKAAAFEMAEQFNWDLPDSVVFPTGGGEGIIGLWKGFKELTDLGWTDRIPRLIVVQSSGCAPLVKAYDRKEPEVKEAWKSPETIAAGLRVPYPYASYLILQAVRETHGTAIAVNDKEILSSMKSFFKMGIYACPEAASALAALNKLEKERALDSNEKILLYLTGTAMKYFDVLDIEKRRIPVLPREADSLN